MRIMAILTGLAAPVLLIGGAVAAESTAAASLTSDLTAQIEATLPDAQVTAVNLRGRPYLLSRSNDLVSTAYVDIRTADDAASTELLVVNLDLTTNRAESVEVLLRFPYPGPAEPVLDADGSFTSSAVLDGAVVTYSAVFADGVVTVFAEGGEAPGQAAAPNLPGLELIGTADARTAMATQDGIVVGLRTEGLRTGA